MVDSTLNYQDFCSFLESNNHLIFFSDDDEDKKIINNYLYNMFININKSTIRSWKARYKEDKKLYTSIEIIEKQKQINKYKRKVKKNEANRCYW